LFESDNAPTSTSDLPEISAFKVDSRRRRQPLQRWERWIPRKKAAHQEQPSFDGMGVLRYALTSPARRRTVVRHAAARRAWLAGAVLVVLPTVLLGGPRLLTFRQAPKPLSPVTRAVPLTQVAVRPGDTLSGIAHRFGLKTRVLRQANPGVDPRHLHPGDVLRLPEGVVVFTTEPGSGDGSALAATYEVHRGGYTGTEAAGQLAAARRGENVSRVLARSNRPQERHELTRSEGHEAAHASHRAAASRRSGTYRVQSGDNPSVIAHRLGVKTRALLAANGLTPHSRLQVGDLLVVPSGAKLKSAGKDGSERLDRKYRLRDGRKIASRGLLGDLGRLAAKRLLWPASGRVSSGFGVRDGHMHQGLDICNSVGTPIKAVRDGVVVSAGWSGAYGRMIDIRHGNGMVTRYAHCAKLYVGEGDRVSRGERIATVGQTGHATGPHLHFEVRMNGRAVNPDRFY
jgi:murein DD-endopeptidase MepM/ murein hydrolase activator NlpD